MEHLRVYQDQESENLQQDQDLLYLRNEKRTEELQNLPKYKAFRDWLAENGVIYPAVDYPVAFGQEGQLIGMGAKKDVPPLTAFLFVPQKLIITEHLVKQSEIGFMINKHPELFRDHYDFEYLVLIIFMMYELMKGEKSFWYPYFQIVNVSDLPFLWSEEEIYELQDTVLKRDIEEYQAEFDNEWILVYETLKQHNYEEYFPGITDPMRESEMKAIFTRAFISVVTRCFGWGLPKTMVIPFADCINHHNVDSTYEMMHTQYQQQFYQHNEPLDQDNIHPNNLGPENYYTKSKLDIDYNDLFKELSMDLKEPREQWPTRTLNQIKKVMQRKSVRDLDLTNDIFKSQKKQIWDIDYMSSSDEEDNDTDEDDVDEEVDQQQKQKQEQKVENKQQNDQQNKSNVTQNKVIRKITNVREKDVVEALLEQDEELRGRDLQARLLKIQSWRKQRQRLGFIDEDYDETENFSWFNFDDNDVYYAMATKFKNYYKKGDQLFNCYGRRTNRFLLINYGFCLQNNKYNSLGFKVFVNYNKDQQENDHNKSPTKTAQVKEDNKLSMYQKVIRLKKNKLCEGNLISILIIKILELLQYLRINLIKNYKGANRNKLLVSSPVDLDFEMFILACALNLMKGMLSSKFATTLQQDYDLMKKLQPNYRKKLALIHRVNQKEILQNQIKLLSILIRILARLKEGVPTLKEAYYLRVADHEGEQQEEIVMNRIRLRKYIREFQHYQQVLIVGKPQG